MSRWKIGWLVLFLAGGGWEVAGLVHPGGGDTLSAIVVQIMDAHPEWAWAGIGLPLVWMIGHWFVVPVWKKRARKSDP